MKIFQIMPEFDLAGAEIMAENLSYYLVGDGHDVTVVSMYTKHTPITDRLEANGIKVVYLNKKSGFDPSIIFKLIKLFKKERPDIIHTHRYLARYAVPAAILSGVKGRVHTVHNMASKELCSRDRKINNFFYKKCGMHPVGISHIIKDTIVEEYGLRPEAIGLIYNGIDLQKCQLKTDYHLNDKFQILHVGRFSEQKNHIGILKAFSLVVKKFPNAVLNFYGMGPTFDECVAFVKESGLTENVNFCGTTDDIYSVMQKSDMFLLCSHYEGMPISLIEAMATQLPIVATNVGGIVDMIDNGENGLLCDNNIEDITEKMTLMMSDMELRKKCGINAGKKATLYSKERMGKEYVKLYQEVLNQTL